MSGVHCERFPVCMVIGVDAHIPICEETGCPGRARQHVARTIAAGLLEPRTNAEIRAAIDGVLLLREQRNAIIEECAQKLEWLVLKGRTINEAIPGIRALKDKP